MLGTILPAEHPDFQRTRANGRERCTHVACRRSRFESHIRRYSRLAWQRPRLLIEQVGCKLLDCGAGPAYGLWNTLRSNVEDVYDHFVLARFQRSVMPLLSR